MTIIEEMRKEAHHTHVASSDYIESMINSWADRLEKSGALVPVPDGEACKADDSDCNFIMQDCIVYMKEPHCWDWATLNGEYAEIVGDSIVQRVRLAPIAEAEL